MTKMPVPNPLHALERLNAGSASPEDLQCLRQALASGQITIAGEGSVAVGGNVGHAVIVVGDVTLTLGDDVLQRLLPLLAQHQPSMSASDFAQKIVYQEVGATDLALLYLPRQWKRPEPPRPGRIMVGRSDEMTAVRKLLSIGNPVAITAAVQGMPGVGKTLLAQHLAVTLSPEFTGGVLFAELGSGHRHPDQCRAILNAWASHAFDGMPLPEGILLTPDAARTLLSGHGPLLVVLDDVWSLDATKPLQAALPFDACLLITTRSQRLANEMKGQVYNLDVLNEADALALLRNRLSQACDADEALLKRLAEALGRHAQALDIAAGCLARLVRERWAGAVQKMADQVRTGSGFGDLHLPGDEQAESRVEVALAFSYQELLPQAQERFRLLGAFAPDASFQTVAAAGIWGCSLEEAQEQLATLVERALLSRTTGDMPDRWQQHSLLRAYALALLTRAGKEETGRERHAHAHLELIRDADDRQEFHRLLADYPQLCHAFDWAIQHDLMLALNLANSTANLQAAFSFVHDKLAWAEALVRKFGKQHGLGSTVTLAGRIANLQVAFSFARDKLAWAEALVRKFRKQPCFEIQAVVWDIFGNALSEIAALPGEDRRGRLLEALDAYGEALQYRRPEVSPLDYAITQHNRALLLQDIATLPGEDRRGRLLEALDAYGEALRYRRPEVGPLDYAVTQSNRALLLRDIATLPGEDRRKRLMEALTANGEALHYRRPGVAPLGYAAAQHNRAMLLSDITMLPGEDRRGRLLDALEAYDEALKYRRPEVVPLDYASTQNNRACLLGDIATLPGEDRRERLMEALEAYGETLQYRRPEVVPLDYAATQNNRSGLLSEIAALPGEDRRGRLLEALEASGKALCIYRPEVAPLDYATTQNTRASLLWQIASLPGEDRRGRLLEALDAYGEALQYRRPEVVPLDYAMTQNNRASLLGDIATLPGEDRLERLMEALVACGEALCIYRPEVAPLDYAMTQDNRAGLLSDMASLPGEDRQGRLMQALEAYGEALRYRRPEVAPQDYSVTQNNRAGLLSQIASLPGEDRRGRLTEALDAYGDTLQYRSPEVDPLGYARTQGNRAMLLSDIAALPGEDRRGRLMQALDVNGDALQYRRPEVDPLGYARTQGNRAVLLSKIATLPGEDRQGRLLEALEALSEAIAKNPAESFFWSNRGFVNYHVRNYAAASADFSAAIERDPERARYYAHRGLSLVRLNRLDEAQQDFEKALSLEVDSIVFTDIAAADILRNNLPGAMFNLRKALEIEPQEMLQGIADDPDFDPVRDFPEFQALLVEFSGDKATSIDGNL